MAIFNHFKHLNLSADQHTALAKLESFINSPVPVFMLKGYAGSGKTTILKGLVEYLKAIEKQFLLIAPTGRAAKVIRERTGQDAYTIHKAIYSYENMVEIEEGDSFYYYYKIRNNVDVAGKLFIVDEASMVSDAKSEGEFFRFGSGHLLSDLITYTRVDHENVKSKIIFVGDPCQLPPVGDNSSKAFDYKYLKDKFNLTSEETEMKEVKRQGLESGILKAAARIRMSISAGIFSDFNLRANKMDIYNPSWDSFLDLWEKSSTSKIIIASKNKTCLDFNLQIRERKFGNANLPMQQGDIVIIGGNNYRKAVFNGEFAVVNNIDQVKVTRIINLKGKDPVTLSWRKIELILQDAESSNKVVSGYMLENFLYGDNTLRPEESQALYVDFMYRHKGLKRKTEEFRQAILNDEYFNCLLMKFGYAVTCHKAQGGEWDNVFTVWDQEDRPNINFLTDEQVRSGKSNQHFFRWAYTAVTRASRNLFAVNPPYFNPYISMSFIDDSAVLDALNDLSGHQVGPEEIVLDKELLQQLTHYNLFDQPVTIQDHFIKVRHAVRKVYIEISGWEKRNMEIFYYFIRTDQAAGLKTWVNKEGILNGKYQVHPSTTTSQELFIEIQNLLKNLPNVSIKRNTAESIVSKIQFDLEQEEKFPFTKSLFDDLELLFKETKIYIESLDHHPYKERYTIVRNQEKACLDFEYNKNGFFGRVLPIKKSCNSRNLLNDLKTLLERLKEA